MSTVRLTNAEIRTRGWEALTEKLGPSGALRFAMQTERGQGDYAARRHRILGQFSVNELLARMRRRPPPSGAVGAAGEMAGFAEPVSPQSHRGSETAGVLTAGERTFCVRRVQA